MSNLTTYEQPMTSPGALQLLLFQLLKVLLQQHCNNASVSQHLEYLEAIEQWHLDLENRTDQATFELDNVQTENLKLKKDVAELESRLNEALSEVETLTREKIDLDKKLNDTTEKKEECPTHYEIESLTIKMLREERAHLEQDLILERDRMDQLMNISEKLDILRDNCAQIKGQSQITSSNTAADVAFVAQEEKLVSVRNIESAGLQAAKQGNTVSLNDLLEKGLDVNAKDEQGRSLLFYSSQEGHLQTTKLLLQKGADPNVKTPNSRDTPLHEAAYYCYLNILKELLKYNANINAQDIGDSTPLHEAVYMNCIPCAKELILNGADQSLKNYDNKTPLEEASDRNFEEIERLLSWN